MSAASPDCLYRTALASILLVDDDKAVLAAIGALLGQIGSYFVYKSDSPEGALHLWDKRSEEIELLVTDIMMPGMSGLQLAEKLLHQKPSLKVLFISGYVPEEIAFPPSAPGYRFLQKPFMRGQLEESISSILD